MTQGPACRTVTAAVALAAPDVTVIVAFPTLVAVTIPVESTLAIAEADDTHVTVAPAMVRPS